MNLPIIALIFILPFLYSQIHVAYSRDTNKKVYVQHMLLENAKDVWRLIGE